MKSRKLISFFLILAFGTALRAGHDEFEMLLSGKHKVLVQRSWEDDIINHGFIEDTLIIYSWIEEEKRWAVTWRPTFIKKYKSDYGSVEFESEYRGDCISGRELRDKNGILGNGQYFQLKWNGESWDMNYIKKRNDACKKNN